MPQTHLIFDPYWDAPPTAQVALMGQVEVSPLVTYNGIEYWLYASYTHADETTENLYRPLFRPPNHAHSN